VYGKGQSYFSRGSVMMVMVMWVWDEDRELRGTSLCLGGREGGYLYKSSQAAKITGSGGVWAKGGQGRERWGQGGYDGSMPESRYNGVYFLFLLHVQCPQVVSGRRWRLHDD
jgi:hypothetical protein